MCDSFSETESDGTRNLKLKRNVLKQLYNIRWSILKKDKDPTELVNKDFVKNIVRFLNMRDENIMKMSLNILIYCCNHDSVANGIIEEIMPTISILLHRSKYNNDTTNFKCCSLIEIIAKNDMWCNKLHEHRITDLLVTILLDEASHRTQMSALRVLRLLWVHSTQHDRRAMLLCNFLQTLDKCISSQKPSVLSEALYLIGTLIKFKSTDALEQMFKFNVGQRLAKRMDLPRVQNVVYNLSLMKSLKAMCSASGFVEAILKQLETHTESTDAVSTLLLSLCYLTDEGLCRSRVRDYPGSVSIILKFADCKAHPLNTKYTVMVLINFLFDPLMIKMLAQDKFLAVFINCVQHINNECGSDHTECVTDELQKSISNQVSDELTLTTGGDGKPLVKVDANSSIFTKLIIDKLLLNLIKHLTFVDVPVIMEFASLSTWQVLLDYMIRVKIHSDCASFILRHVIKNCKYMSTLMKNNIPLLVHRAFFRLDHAGCDVCKINRYHGRDILNEFCYTSRSSYVTQLFTNELSDTRKEVRIHGSCTLACMFATRPKLNHFLSRYPIIDNVLEAMTSDEFFEDGVAGICTMANAFTGDNLNWPHPSRKNIVFAECQTAYEVADTFETTVSFRLDDDSVVSLNKDRLSSESPVFRAMLFGDFKEKSLTEIRLTGITSDCLKLLHHCSAHKYCRCPTKVPLHVLLESIVQADRFLIDGLQLLPILLNYTFTCDNCCEIYVWSHEILLTSTSLTETLRSKILDYLFSGRIDFENRCKTIKCMLETEYATEIVQHIRTIIKEKIEADKNDRTNERHRKLIIITYG